MMRRIKLSVVVIACVGMALCGKAALQAYATFSSWASASATFFINPVNADVAETDADAAVQAAMDVWNTQGGSSFRYSYGGRVTDTTTGNDGRNVIIFRNASSGSALATTYSWWSGNSLIDADVVFWDGGFTFFTGSSGCSGGAYIEDVASHELGHALGLSHSTVPDATMYPSYSYCSQEFRTLAADDIAGVQSLYPKPVNTNTAPTVSIASPVNNASFAQGTAVSFSGTGIDTQDGVLTASLTWTSDVQGTIGAGGAFSTSTLAVGRHVITASATDSGQLSGSGQVVVTITASTAPILSGRGYKVKGAQKVDLTWKNFSSQGIDIYRNSVRVMTTPNDGAQTDPVNRNGAGTYVYKACESGAATVCSNTLTIVF